MTVNEFMTDGPACCTPNTSLREVARMMVDCDCGEIPVVLNQESRRLVGVVTDRDIVCRVIASGKNPLEMTANDCLSSPVVSVMPETTLEECCRIMEQSQIRRVPVIDGDGACCGIVSQADIAARTSFRMTAELLKEVSRHASSPSHVGWERTV